MEKSVKDIIDGMEFVINADGRPHHTWTVGLLGVPSHNQGTSRGTIPYYRCNPVDAKIIFEYFVEKGVLPSGRFNSNCEGVFLYR